MAKGADNSELMTLKQQQAAQQLIDEIAATLRRDFDDVTKLRMIGVAVAIYQDTWPS